MFNQFARYEDAFRDWRRDGYPGVKPETYEYIDFLSAPDDDQAAREGTLWPHQWEAFLRVVYSHEILGKTKIGEKGLLLNVVTGGGKTAAIAALIAWLRVAHSVRKFLLLCPNLIVRDRLEEDFDGGKVFRDRDLLPASGAPGPEDFPLTTLGAGKSGGWASLFSADVILGNIHQFYQSNKSGQSNLSALMNGPEFALFNDEAHNSPAEEYDLGDFDEPAEPVENWGKVLAGLEYDPTVVEITEVEIDAVIGKELTGERWTTIQSATSLSSMRMDESRLSRSRIQAELTPMTCSASAKPPKCGASNAGWSTWWRLFHVCEFWPGRRDGRSSQLEFPRQRLYRHPFPFCRSAR